MKPDDRSLFLDAMQDVQPLKRCTDIHWQPAPKARDKQSLDLEQLDNFLTTGYLDLLPLAEPLAYQREGIQQGVVEKLRLGKYPRQASLSLLRTPVEQCRQRLFSFICQAEREGLRNLIIVHGKGREADSHANIVRSYLARWLTEFEAVQAFCPAQPHHGGSGACYVALRKSSEAKLDTRERHAKRSR